MHVYFILLTACLHFSYKANVAFSDSVHPQSLRNKAKLPLVLCLNPDRIGPFLVEICSAFTHTCTRVSDVLSFHLSPLLIHQATALTVRLYTV